MIGFFVVDGIIVAGFWVVLLGLAPLINCSKTGFIVNWS